MRIFVTGAAGYLGQAVSQRFLRAGHEVEGLVRSEVAVGTVRSLGVGAVIGSLDDLATIDLSSYDAIVDTATADHAPSTKRFLDELRGSGRTLIRTSGTGVYTDLGGGVASDVVYRESDAFTPAPVVATCVASDEGVVAAAGDGVRSIVIRPAMVYGDGGSEQLPLLIRTALATGRSIYAGQGANRWGNVFLHDLAEVYLLALTGAQPGAVYNIASGEAEMRDIARAIARLLSLGEAEGVALGEAHEVFGERWVDVALASNSRVDSTLARTELGWEPKGPTLLDDLRTGSYRRIWASKADPHDHLTR